jgi:hypothetical protein
MTPKPVPFTPAFFPVDSVPPSVPSPAVLAAASYSLMIPVPKQAALFGRYFKQNIPHFAILLKLETPTVPLNPMPTFHPPSHYALHKMTSKSSLPDFLAQQDRAAQTPWTYPTGSYDLDLSLRISAPKWLHGSTGLPTPILHGPHIAP